MSFHTISKAGSSIALISSTSSFSAVCRVRVANQVSKCGLATFENSLVVPNTFPGYNTHVQNKIPIALAQAVYKLPENAAKSTFLYTKLPLALIPPGWSNHPFHLELASSVDNDLPSAHGSASGAALPVLKTALPVLVTLHQTMNEGDYDYIEWFLFQTPGGFYLRHGVVGDLRRIVQPVGLKGILKGIRGEGVRGLRVEMCEEEGL